MHVASWGTTPEKTSYTVVTELPFPEWQQLNYQYPASGCLVNPEGNTASSMGEPTALLFAESNHLLHIKPLISACFFWALKVTSYIKTQTPQSFLCLQKWKEFKL